MAVCADMWAVVPDAIAGLHEVRVPRPVRRPGEVLVRVLAAGIAAHDLEDSANRSSSVAGSQHKHTAPVVVGTVEQVDPEHQSLVGRPVAVMPAIACHETGQCSREHTLASHQQENARLSVSPFVAEWVSVPAASILPLPVGRPLEESTLLGVAAGTLSAVRKARVEIGESVAVLGTDVALVLAAQWVRVAGAYDVYIVDNDPRGLGLARKLWLGERIDANNASAPSAVRAQRDGRGVDLAIVLAGDAKRLRLAMDLVEPGGRVLALTASTAGCSTDRAPASHINCACLIKASSDAAGASRLDWEIAARTWGSGRLALRDLSAARIPVQGLVARANAGLTGDEGFMVTLAPDRA